MNSDHLPRVNEYGLVRVGLLATGVLDAVFTVASVGAAVYWHLHGRADLVALSVTVGGVELSQTIMKLSLYSLMPATREPRD